MIQGLTFRSKESIYLASNTLKTHRPNSELDFKYEGLIKVKELILPVKNISRDGQEIAALLNLLTSRTDTIPVFV